MSNLTLVIPAKSEALSLPIVLKELDKFDYHIFVVLEETDNETIDAIKNNTKARKRLESSLEINKKIITGIRIILNIVSEFGRLKVILYVSAYILYLQVAC